MSKFKVGDKVRLRDDPQARAPHPATGRKLPASKVFEVEGVWSCGILFLRGYKSAWDSERFKKVEEYEMVDVKIGDLVKLTRKGEPERTVTDYVTRSDRKELVLKGDVTGYYHSADWDVEVLKRPYKLPTVPGLYTVAKANDKILGGALFELNEFGDWTANGNLHTPYAGDLVVDFLKDKEWPLKRLVIEE